MAFVFVCMLCEAHMLQYNLATVCPSHTIFGAEVYLPQPPFPPAPPISSPCYVFQFLQYSLLMKILNVFSRKFPQS